MAYIRGESPYPLYCDESGFPLEAGKIYIGVYGLNPITNPIAVFYDSAGTLPAAQPLRTLNGYIALNGSPRNLYISSSSYSIAVLNSNNTIVYTNTKFLSGAVPIGMIMLWSGSVATIPSGWNLCDGTNGTPNLLDRFVAAAGGVYAPGTSFGNDNITLTLPQIPSHAHGVNINSGANGAHGHTVNDPGHTHVTNTVGYVGEDGNSGPDSYASYIGPNPIGASVTGISINAVGNHIHSVVGTTDSQGGGQSIDIRPSAYALCYIMFTGIL